MAVSSISIPRFPIGVSQLLSTYRVANLSVRGEMTSSQTNHRPGDGALGPQVTLFDGLGSLLATQQSYERLFSIAQMQNRSQPASGMERYEAALKSLSRIEQSSRRLEFTLEDIMVNGDLNTNQAFSNVPGVRVGVDPAAETGEYYFTLRQPARGQKIASAVQSNPLSPLGLEGTIRIEGEDIEVALDDNLIDLASSINNAFEERDFTLTATVDDENRLIIEGSAERPYPLQIVDPDSIAGALGLIEQDESGNFQVANVLISPQKAEVEVDGIVHTFETNRLSGLFPGLEIELIPEGFSRLENEFGTSSEASMDVEIRVERDIAGPRQALLRFVEAYNQTINSMNEALLFSGTLEGDRSLAAARSRLIRTLEEPVPGAVQGETNFDIRDIGLEVLRSEPREVSELTLRRLAMLDASGQPPSPVSTTQREISILQGLNRLGIRQENDGTLQVDRGVLDESLEERAPVVNQILQEEQESVLPRLNRELSALRDADMGILARRRRLFQSLQEKPWKYLNPTNLTFESQFEVLQNTQKYQTNQLQLIYQNQFGSNE